jgi:WD40 repeat protein
MSSPSRNGSPQPLTARNLGVPLPIPIPTKNPSPDPRLTMSITHRLNTGGSVQALTILADDCLIAGLQGGSILVSRELPLLFLTQVVEVWASTTNKAQAWSLSTYQLLFSFQAHQEGVLSLYVSDDGELLFSGGADSIVNVGAKNKSPPGRSSLTLIRSGPRMTSNVSIPSTPPKTWVTSSLLSTLRIFRPFFVVRRTKASRFARSFRVL